MKRCFSYLLALLVAISCGCSQTSFELNAKPVGKYPIQGIFVGSILDENSQSFYSIIAKGDMLKICDGKTRTLVISEMKLPGSVISKYQLVHECYMICRSRNGNLLVCYLYNDEIRKLELHKLFETQTQASQIIGDVSGENVIVTQSEDRTTLYLHNEKTGSLINIIKYPKPTIWWRSNIGFDGQDLIYQTGYKNGFFEETRKKITESSSIGNAFFQITGSYTDYIDLYDGKNLWRINTDIIYSTSSVVKGPLEIKNLEKGYNQLLYPYEKGLCMIGISEVDSNQLVLKHIDDRKMYPIDEFSLGNIWAPVGYFLYGYKKEDGNYSLKCFKFFQKDQKSYKLHYEERDIHFVFGGPNEDILDSDYYHPMNDFSNITFNLYTKDFTYSIPNVTNW